MTHTVWLLWNGRDDAGRAPTLVGVYADPAALREDAKAIRGYDRRARLWSRAEEVRGLDEAKAV